KGEAMPPPAAGGRGGAPEYPGDDDLLAAPAMEGGDPADGLAYLAPSPQQDSGGSVGGPGGIGQGQSGCAPRTRRPGLDQARDQGQGGRGGRGAASAGATAPAAAETPVCS